MACSAIFPSLKHSQSDSRYAKQTSVVAAIPGGASAVHESPAQLAGEMLAIKKGVAGTTARVHHIETSMETMTNQLSNLGAQMMRIEKLLERQALDRMS